MEIHKTERLEFSCVWLVLVCGFVFFVGVLGWLFWGFFGCMFVLALFCLWLLFGWFLFDWGFLFVFYNQRQSADNVGVVQEHGYQGRLWT